MSFRPTSFFVPSSTELKIFFSDRISESVGVGNFAVESISGSGSDLEVISVTIDQKLAILKTRPQAPNNYYLLKLLDTPSQKFESYNGTNLLDDDVSRSIFFLGVLNVNRVRDDIISKMPQIYSVDGTLISNVISNIADEILKTQHDIGSVLNSNYLKIPVFEEPRTRGSGAYDRLANENAYEVLSVSKFRSSENIFNKEIIIDRATTYPINIRESFVEEEISSETNSNSFDGFLLNLSKKFVTRVTQIKVIRYLEEENCSGTIGELYDINKYKYSIISNRFDPENAFAYFNLSSNQVLLSELGNLDRFGSRDKVYVSYYYEDRSININETTTSVFSLIDKTNESVPSNSSRFFLKNAPIVNSSGATITYGGVKFKVSENLDQTPSQFLTEIPYNISRLPRLAGEYAVNYQTGEVILVGDGSVIGTGYNYFVASYIHKKIWLNNLDYFANNTEVSFNQDRELIGKKVYINYSYSSMFSDGSDYLPLTHNEVLGELVENRFTSSFSFKTKNPQITDVFRVSNITTGEVYSILYNNENEVFISGRNLPRVETRREESSNFKQEFNEPLVVSGELISNMHTGRIISNPSTSAIEFYPPLPEEFISSGTTYFFRIKSASDDESSQIDDTQILYFHSADGNGNISKFAINSLNSVPSVGSEVYIGPKVYFFNLKNNMILNEDDTSIGSLVSNSVYFNDAIFENEKYFEKINSSKSLQSKTADSMFFTINSDETDILYKNISRLRRYGDYCIDYFNGVIYLAVNDDTAYYCGDINYKHSRHIANNKNVLSADIISKKNNLFGDSKKTEVIYNDFVYDPESIKILDLESSLSVYNGSKINPLSNSEVEELFVYEDYTAYTKNNISSISIINKAKNLFGENLNYINGSLRVLDSSSGALKESILNNGKNYYNKNYISFEFNQIDFKKKSNHKLVFTDGLATLNIKDEHITNIYNILDFNSSEELMNKDGSILLLEETIVNSVSDYGVDHLSIVISEINSEYIFKDGFDYVLDQDGNIFKIIFVNYFDSTIVIEKTAENDSSITFDSSYISVVCRPQISTYDGLIQILIPENITTKSIQKVQVAYLTIFSIEPGTALAVNYNFGNIVFDYTYIIDNVQVWYEYGDNSIDWSINNSINEGELYYVTYNYGALRSALRQNFGLITGIPKLKNISLNMNREVYRDFLIGVLQSFPKGPTIPAISGLIESVTKTKPEITESFFGDWVLGRDYLDSSKVEFSGDLKFEPAKFGDGLLIDQNTSVSVPSISNLPLNEGTVSFWMKPLWDGINNDATLTFKLENVGTSIIQYDGGISPFSNNFGFDVSSNADENFANFGTDFSSGKLTIFKNIVNDSFFYESFVSENFSVYNKKFNISRLNKTRLNFEIKQNYLHKGILSPYLGFDLEKYLGGGYSLISDGYKVILVDLGLLSFKSEPIIFIDSSVSSESLPSYGPPYITRGCACSSISSGLSSLVEFNNLTFEITLSDLLDKNDIIYSDNSGMNDLMALQIVDQEGRLYELVSIVDGNGVIHQNKIPDIISKFIVSKFPVNDPSLSSRGSEEINSIDITSFMVLNKVIRIRNNVTDLASDKSYQFFGSPRNILINWSNFTRVRINREPGETNKVNINIDDISLDYFYTDFSSSADIAEYLPNLNQNNFSFGVLSASSIDIRKVRFEIDHKYSLSDVYIGSSSLNPRKNEFSLNRFDQKFNSNGISQKIDFKEGIFIGYDDNCKSPVSSEIGQWLFKVRNDRFLSLPSDVEILDENVFVNKMESFEINETLVGRIETDGDFSSVSRGRRTTTNNCASDSNDCYSLFRYCAERILSIGWNKIEDIDLQNVTTQRTTNIIPWRKAGEFDEELTGSALRLTNFSAEDLSIPSYGLGMFTNHGCVDGISLYSTNIKINSIDTNIISFDLNKISSSFVYSGISPVIISDEDYSISACYVVNQDGVGFISLINRRDLTEVSSVNFDWFDGSYHQISIEVNKVDGFVKLYADDALLIVSAIENFESEKDTLCLLGTNNYVGFAIIDAKTIDSEIYLANIASPSIDIDLISLESQYSDAISKLENEDILIHESDQAISFQFSSNSDDDIYSPDGYEQVSDLDEIFITSDKRRYFIDSAISDSNSRISIFKDGKGFLNFRIYDFEVGEKNSTYNIATSIKHFMFGEVHHIAASWKLNSTDESDQMHLFIDGFEAPNLYKFGGTIPLKLNSKFSDISQEILQDYLFRNITYSADMVGSISAGDNKILSSSISGTEDIISRGILIKSSDLDENIVNRYYIISGVGPGYIELLSDDASTDASFDVSSNITFSYPPTTSSSYLIKTDIKNERFAIKITDCDENTIEVGGVEVGKTNGIPFVSSTKTTNPYFRWNSTLGLIEFIRYNDLECKWVESASRTDLNISIITFGLKLRKVSNLIQLSSSTLSTEDSNDLDFIFDKSGWISLINLTGPLPRSIGDVSIKKILIESTISESSIYEDSGSNICDFSLDNNELFGLLTSQEIIKEKINDGRYLSIKIDSDNIIFCGIDGETAIINYIDVYGDNESGMPYERIFIKENGTISTENRFYNLASVSGKFSCKDVEWEALYISVSERDSMFVQNGASTTPVIFRLIDNKLIISELGSESYEPFEVPPGYYRITYGAALSLSLPMVGNKLFIGSDYKNNNKAGAIFDDFVIRNEMLIDVKSYESSNEYENSITYDYNRNNPVCLTQNILTLINFDNPYMDQARLLRNTYFLNELTNEKEKLTSNELEKLISVVNNRNEFENMMVDMGYSKEIATRTWFVTSRANGGPIKNLADFYPKYDNLLLSNSGPNNSFGQSARFDKNDISIFNNNSILRNNAATIEFWVSPLKDTLYDSGVRFYFDSYSAVKKSVESTSSRIIKLNNAASKILNIKLLKDTKEFSSYIPEDKSNVIFDEIRSDGITGMLEGGTGTDKDFSVGCTLSADGKTIYLADILPGAKTYVIVSYIPKQFTGQRISIFKDRYSRIIFRIISGDTEYFIPMAVDWDKNSWHRIFFSYTANSKADFMRAVIDGVSSENIYIKNNDYNDFSDYLETTSISRPSIKLSDEFSEIKIGNNIFKNCIAHCRLDNIRISRDSRKISRDSSGSILDPNYSSNILSINPVQSDDLTTLMLDFDDNLSNENNIATIYDPKNGIFDFDVNIFDAFDRINLMNSEYVEDLLVELINRIKPAHTNSLIKFKKRYCKK
jgi:hypothetical protein